jgi:hypothetical protein
MERSFLSIQLTMKRLGRRIVATTSRLTKYRLAVARLRI